MSQITTITVSGGAAGKFVNQASYMSNAVILIDDNVATPIPYDNTTPQINEGVQIASLVYTPANANNILYIHIEVPSTNGNDYTAIALFANGGPDALAARNCSSQLPGSLMLLTHRMVAGSVAPITFTWRAGLDSAGFGDVLVINGDENENPIYGGVSNVIAFIYEFEP